MDAKKVLMNYVDSIICATHEEKKFQVTHACPVVSIDDHVPQKSNEIFKEIKDKRVLQNEINKNHFLNIMDKVMECI